ncbi:coiled-coil domain-containing protein 96-like [Orbicella faveolata]|uniref:coiled-coil domain-containing protein 96-like n=1 Tax=Orbicella faveolata TaxID=48498 RepID=UPI0009E2853A|nr:coiled-coil domain-containing protein 96-like [Orbicella faveolata]
MRYDEMEFDEESEPEIPLYNRAELIERYQQALEERSSLQSLNAQLQHKLAEYFKKKKSDERQQEIEKNVTDQEQRYLKYMSNLEELQNEERREKENYKDQIEDLKAKCQEKQEIVNRSSDNFMMFKNDVAKQAINSRSGKPISPKDLEQYQMLELKKEQEVMQVRLENIKLKNRLKKREMQLKAKEELAEGLHLIDFEQLKIENQTYNEKIEERNEELLKLRKKITTTVQVLTHLKEKLQFVQAENSEQRSNLRTVEAHAAQKRDILTRTKQVRDALRIENVKLRQKCGLLGNEPLLRDYEQRKEQSDELRAKIERLKMDHAELTMNCSGVRTKIEGARQEEKPL